MPTSDTSSDRDLHATRASTAFSAELLRIALLVLTALGALLLKISERDFDDVTGLCMEFLPAFICLILCAAFALTHRLLITQFMARHLVFLRRKAILNAEPDQDNDAFRRLERSEAEYSTRSALFKTVGTWSLILSALTLVLSLILAAHPVIDALATPLSSGDSAATDTVIRTSTAYAPAHRHLFR